MKKFALIGTAGYVAPRHLKAIKETENQLIASMDLSDSVGIVDTYFPDAAFFTEFERFDRYLEKQKIKQNQLDFLSICSPNYLHDAHIRYGLKLGADVICEKPLVLSPWNLDALKRIELETGKKVYTILQLRLIPELISLKEKIQSSHPSSKHQVELSYITPRGKWYYASWKGNPEKSGGVTTNIGIHLFDLMIWLFGPVQQFEIHQHTHDRASGFLELERAQVKWFLSINKDHLPQEAIEKGMRSYRSIKMDKEELEFSKGFEDLHTMSYRQILNGRGFTIDEAYPSVDLVHKIRKADINIDSFKKHPLSILPPSKHPFE